MRRLFPIAIVAWWGCTSPAPDPRTDDRPTSGDVVVLAEEEFKGLLEGHRLVFEMTYPKARVRIHYLPQAELLQAMLNDSVRAAFTTCAPGQQQVSYLRERKVPVTLVPVLVDAVAVVRGGGQARPITVDELRARLRDPAQGRILFDHPGSGVARTVVDSLLGGDASMLKAAVVPGMDSLVARLQRDTTVLGMISFARISDLDDPIKAALRKRLTLVPIASVATAVAEVPTQSNLAGGTYPLRRRMYALNMEGKTGLGTGFVSFVAGHKGQRIILKSGLAPHTIPARNVMLVNP